MQSWRTLIFAVPAIFVLVLHRSTGESLRDVDSKSTAQVSDANPLCVASELSVSRCHCFIG